MRDFKGENDEILPLESTTLTGPLPVPVLKRLMVLAHLGFALQTQLDEERLLRIMLSGVTAGEALGFNRAMVFLLNNEKTEFAGRLGVGPVNEEECGHIWKCIAERKLTLLDFIDEFDQLTKYQTTQLNLQTQSIRVPVGERTDIFTLALEEKKCFRVTPELYWDLVPKQVFETLQAQELVVAPLVIPGTHLGVVVVDNKFSGRPISEQDVQLLSVVANQTAAALSHIRLIRKLEEFQSILEEKVREAVAEKERAQGELIRHAKLATVGEMAVTIAHEIRNPLTAVRGFAQRLHRKQDDPETIKAYSQIIMQEVDRLNHVLGDTLDFTRNVDALFGPVNLNEIVENAVQLMQERFGRSSILCETSLDPQMPVCHYDGPQLSQVLINLMKNGAEAMHEGGVLQINTRVQEESCILEVADTGCGIPQKNVEHIFEAFYTTKSRGTGLGLAFAKRVIEEHDGQIEAESEIGTGTTFRIVLPKRLRAPRMEEVIESLEMVKPILDPSDPLASREDLTRQPRGEADSSKRA